MAEFHLPEIGEGVYEAELVAWLVKAGDAVKRGQDLMEVLTDKATMEVPAPFAGTITTLHAEPGQQVKVGDVVLTYTPAGQKGDGANQKDGGVKEASTPPPKNDRAHRSLSPPPAVASIRAAPSVRQLARKLGVDLSGVRGTGPQGRILIEDLSTHVKPAGADERPLAPEPRPDFGKPGTRVKLIGLRRKIAEHMVLSKRTIPHYSYVDECDVTELVRLRESLKEPFIRGGLRLTYLAFFVKAAVAALQQVPLVNASLDEKSGEIVLHDRYHIGVAVATPGGLIVPVIRDADRKGLAQIASEIERLGNETRTGKVRPEELRGSTFTITSIGGIGGLISTPVINHPEVAILGIGKVVKRPVYDNAGNLHPADLVYLSFSFDHRVLDGAIGAAFGNALIRQLQDPARLLLPEKLV